MEWFLIMMHISSWDSSALPDTARTIGAFNTIEECEHEIHRLTKKKYVHAMNVFSCSRKEINNYKQLEVK